MNMSKLPLAAALMLGISAVANPATVSAQDKDGDRPAATEKAKPADSPSRQQPESAPRSETSDKGEMKRDSANRGEERGKSKRSAERDGPDRASDSKKERADRTDKDRPKQGNEGKQSESKSDQPADKKADRKDGDAKKKRDSADGQKPSDAPKEANKPADENKRSASDESPKGDSAKLKEAKNADLSGDKKERITSSFKKETVKEVTNVNIDISVGRRLPRDWDYHPVPTAVIEIVPAYRGYRYVYVEDRYVIVDPDTYEVVYVLDEEGGASVGRSTGESGSASGQCTTELTFTAEDRHFIIEKVRKPEAVLKIGELEIGATLPGDVEVETFPAEVTTRVTKLGDCRYVIIDDRVAVVDPSNEKIVAFIED